MNNIIPFDFNSQAVRVVNDDNGEPWFVAKDVADVLQYSQTDKLVRLLDSDEFQNLQIGGSGFNNKGTLLINEAGLYTAVIKSNKPEAKPFKRWITHEVLPSIRKTGGYGTQQPVISESNERFFNLALKTLNPDPVSKLTMLKKFGEIHGVPPEFLPDYTESQGTHHSLSELLKKHGSDLSARKANNLLVDRGLLEVKTRQSRTKGTKSFKSVTDIGLKYGCNLVNPNNPNETQAHWYDDSFDDLLKLIA